jgi:hypothetical protein
MLIRAAVIAGVFFGVVVVISGAFLVGYSTLRPRAEYPAQTLALFWAFMSALAWGLSVVGSLFWWSLGLISSMRWNSWFNFFAAGFAALAVGYSTP